MGRRILIAGALLVAIFLAIELVGFFLVRPNRLELDGNFPHLVTTRWHQVGDYARFVTLDDDAGCWATAIAQIAHFHRLNLVGEVEYETSGGAAIKIDLDELIVDHEGFVDEIGSNTPKGARDQVAQYIYAVACILYTDFGASGYLEHDTFVERIENHLDCTVGFHEYDKARYLAEKDRIATLVREEIGSARPLMLYFDNGDDFGHAAVIDGLHETGGRVLVHLNLGWGGKHDGWYDLFEPIVGVRDDLQNRFLITIKPA